MMQQMEDKTEWLTEHLDGWNHALERLRSEGWTVELTCDAAPVQIEGTIPSGESLYFRARGNSVSVRLVRGLKDRFGSAGQEYGTTEFAASYLPADPGAQLLRDLTAQVLAEWERSE
jgi:hypothetical protein